LCCLVLCCIFDSGWALFGVLRMRDAVVTWSLHGRYMFVTRLRDAAIARASRSISSVSQCIVYIIYCLFRMYCIYYILFVPNVLYILYIVCSQCIVYIIDCLFPIVVAVHYTYVKKQYIWFYTYDTLMHPCRSATLPCLSSLPPLYICHDARAPPCAMHSMPVLLPALMPASLSPRLPAPSLSPLLPACLPNLSSLRLPSCPPSSRSLVWCDIKFHPI